MFLARNQLLEREQEDRRMAEEIAKREALVLDADVKHKSIKEEIDAKTRKLNVLVNKLKDAKEQYNEMHEYRLREKEMMLEDNRNIIKELKLINLIIEHFIPADEVKKLENRLEFSEEVDDWVIKDN